MYSQEVADAICAQLAEGKSLRAASSQAGVRHSSVIEWTKTNPGFADQYTRAREVGYQLLADEIIDISDRSQSDTYTDKDGNEKTNAEVVARSRLMVDSRKWMLSKMLPKIYGDKLTTEVTGNLTHDHTIGLQPESQRFLEAMRAGTSSPGSAVPVSD